MPGFKQNSPLAIFQIRVCCDETTEEKLQQNKTVMWPNPTEGQMSVILQHQASWE